MKLIKFKCYTIKKDGVFVSANVTLNLFCTGATLMESQKNLIRLTRDYLEEAIINKDIKTHKHLLKRPAPLFMHIDYMKCFFMQILFSVIFKLSSNFVAFKRKFEIDYSINKLRHSH